MYEITSSKMEMAERIAGILGIICFFFPFVTESSLWGTPEKISGIGWLWGVILHLGEADSDAITAILWIGGALIAGAVGIIATFSVTTLVGGIANTAAVGCLFFLKDFLTSESRGILQTGIGWTLSLVAFIVAAVCGFIAVYLAGKEAEQRKKENKPVISNMDDDALLKLKNDLAKFRIDDEKKK